MIIFTPNVRDTVVAYKRSTLLSDRNVASFSVGSACKPLVSTVYSLNKDNFHNILAGRIWTKCAIVIYDIHNPTGNVCLTISDFHFLFFISVVFRRKTRK